MNARALVAALVLIAGGANAADCEVSGEDAMREAQNKGFVFKATRSGGQGSCIRHRYSFLATASYSEAVTCTVQFFGSHRLKSGWTMNDAWLSGDWEYSRKLAPGSNAFFEITVTAEANTTNTVSLTRVRLVGAKCASWKDAF